MNVSLALDSTTDVTTPLVLNADDLTLTAAQCAPGVPWLYLHDAMSVASAQPLDYPITLNLSSAMTGASSAVNASNKAGVLTTCFFLTATDTLALSFTPKAIQVDVTVFVPCDFGFNSSDGTNLEAGCEPCQLGTYQDARGQTTCNLCDVTTPKTQSPGSTTSQDCEPCALGYFCELGHSAAPCAPFGYESLANALALDGRHAAKCENLTCEAGWWCGAGAAEGSTYRQVLSFANQITSTVVIKSTRALSWTISNLDPVLGMYVRPVGAADFITSFSVDGNATVDLTLAPVFVRASSSVTISFTVSAEQAPSGTTALNGAFLAEWFMENDALPSPFQVSVAVSVAITQPLVTPSRFVYTIANVSSYVLNPDPIVQVFNTLCNNSIVYSVVQGCSDGAAAQRPSWFVYNFSLNNPTTIAAQQGLPDSLAFLFNFSRDDTATTNLSLPAPQLVNCFTISIDMVGLGLNATFPVTTSVTLTQPCPPGMFAQTGDNMQGCSLCPKGSYIDKPGQTACLACGATRPITRFEGSTSADNCTVRSGSLIVNGTALLCPVGANCTRADGYGYTVETLPLLPAYYRTSATSLNILACSSRPWYCIGGAFNVSANATTSTRRRLDFNGPDQGPLCRQYHTGPFCYSCMNTYVKRGGLHVCSECDPATVQADELRVGLILFALIVLLMAIVGFIVWRFYVAYKAIRDRRHDIEAKVTLFGEWLGWLDMGSKVKILVGLLQVVGGMYYSMGDELPALFQQSAPPSRFAATS